MSALTKTVKLARPIAREGGEVGEVTIVEPNAGSMRGLKLSNVMQMDVTAMLTLLPRITKPVLEIAELEQMGPRDFSQLCQETVLFFVTSSEFEALSRQSSASPTT